MNFEDFIKIAEKYGAMEQYTYGKDLGEDSFGFMISWKSGGMSGGDCWDGVAEEITPEDEPSFESPYNLLSALFQNIDKAKIQELIYPLIQNWSYTDDSDYYGNYYICEYKFISLKQLYKVVIVDLELKTLTEITEKNPLPSKNMRKL